MLALRYRYWINTKLCVAILLRRCGRLIKIRRFKFKIFFLFNYFKYKSFDFN
jgi:hypothetical protein